MQVIILEQDINIIKEKPVQDRCILCKSNKWVDYGDEKNGFVYCKTCFDNYSCFYCKKMNISIYGKKVIIRESNGYRFLLFCDTCWLYKNVYEEKDTINEELDSSNYELNDDDLAEDNDSGSDEDINNHDLYHNTKGKYDLY